MSRDVAAVIRAEERLAQAHVDMDLAVIADLLHPDYVILQPNDQTETRQAVLDSYRSGDRRWDSARVDEMNVSVSGNAAVVTGRWRATGQNGAEPFDYVARFLSVWVTTDAGWRNVSYSAVAVVEEGPAEVMRGNRLT